MFNNETLAISGYKFADYQILSTTQLNVLYLAKYNGMNFYSNVSLDCGYGSFRQEKRNF